VTTAAATGAAIATQPMGNAGPGTVLAGITSRWPPNDPGVSAVPSFPAGCE
jgi:hypothetical protein